MTRAAAVLLAGIVVVAVVLIVVLAVNSGPWWAFLLAGLAIVGAVAEFARIARREIGSAP